MNAEIRPGSNKIALIGGLTSAAIAVHTADLEH
jgi:hypothetical protein